MRQIAIYGKGGIGKSTVSGNLTTCLAHKGYNVLHMGCDPKCDSTRLVMGGKLIQPVLDTAREITRDKISLDMVRAISPRFSNLACIEAGGPDPGIGCAGRGVISAIQLMEQLNIYSNNYDFVLYDVLGDVVCGGFAMPIRQNYAKEIYIVISEEMMAFYAANNICKAIKRFGERGECRLGGLICNSKRRRGEIEREEELVEKFASRLGTNLVKFIPWDPVVQISERNRMPVVDFAPESEQASIYQDLTERIIINRNFSIPEPMTLLELEELCFEYGTY